MIGKKVRVLAKPFGEGWAKEEYGQAWTTATLPGVLKDQWKTSKSKLEVNCEDGKQERSTSAWRRSISQNHRRRTMMPKRRRRRLSLHDQHKPNGCPEPESLHRRPIRRGRCTHQQIALHLTASFVRSPKSMKKRCRIKQKKGPSESGMQRRYTSMRFDFNLSDPFPLRLTKTCCLLVMPLFSTNNFWGYFPADHRQI